MIREHQYYVYIVASRSRTLYVGVTNNLIRRVVQHRKGDHDGFTAKYRIHRLVYFERFQYVRSAIAREKELKGWLRERKITLIAKMNPTWHDFYPLLTGEDKQVLRSAQDDNSYGMDNHQLT